MIFPFPKKFGYKWKLLNEAWAQWEELQNSEELKTLINTSNKKLEDSLQNQGKGQGKKGLGKGPTLFGFQFFFARLASFDASSFSKSAIFSG